MNLVYNPGDFNGNAYLAHAINFWGLKIAFYALCILFGIILAITFSIREAKKLGMDSDKLFTGAVFGIVVGIIGARIYSVIFDFANYKDNFISVFYIWNGGLAIQGGIIAGFVFAYIYCKKTNLNLLQVLDLVAIGFLFGQICGRWGNFFNQEVYGSVTSYEFLKSIGLPKFIINQMYIDGAYRQPLFLYESLLNLLCLVVLLILRRTKTIRLGDQAGIYFIYYGLIRAILEPLRASEYNLMIGPFKQSLIMSILICAFGVAFMLFKYLKLKPDYYVNYFVDSEAKQASIEKVDEKTKKEKKQKEKKSFDKLKNFGKKKSYKEIEEASEEDILKELEKNKEENQETTNETHKSKYIIDDED